MGTPVELPKKYDILISSIEDKEEEMMLNQFGDLYRKYMKKTNRLTPFT